MALNICPFSHVHAIYRDLCPVCQRETLHRTFTCLSCGHRPTIVVVHKKAFGARLVLNRKRRS